MTVGVHVVASCAMSVDGHIDDTSDERLVVSDTADLDRVDELRAGCDAILVGANTVRVDNPRLVIRSAERRRDRRARGLPESPVKVTLTASGDLDAGAAFFTEGEADKLVYCAGPAVAELRRRLGHRAQVVDAGDPLSLHSTLADLGERGIRRLMVEGGQHTHTAFLTAGLVDEIQLTIAPFFVGAAAAPRFVGPGLFPHGPDHPMGLTEVRRIGDHVLLRYRLQRPPT